LNEITFANIIGFPKRRLEYNTHKMLSNNDLELISKTIIAWYKIHKRSLPWRNSDNPYTIWISEIILQQTRVVQGYDYFLHFLEQFPDIKSLAEASEDEVLKCWQGLGYYSRARNLHAAAKQLQAVYGNKFPQTYDEIRRLKGIGDYTAAAISSFAFHLPYAVVDGNVYRFLSRYFGIETPIDSTVGKKFFASLATDLLNKRDPGTHNQAIMEFGALQCAPSSPDCAQCPLATGCFALSNNKVSTLPVKAKKSKVQHRYFHYFMIINNQTTYLNKRTGKDIWQNLYEFPLYESLQPMDITQILQTDLFVSLTQSLPFFIKHQSPEIKHVLSHQIIHAHFYVIQTSGMNNNMSNFIPVKMQELSHYPISRLMENFVKKISKNLPF
jgi:A/G-specific adenine glycosylase